MKSRIKLFIFIFFLSIQAFGQDSSRSIISHDSSAISLRAFDNEKLRAYQNDSDFIYEINEQKEMGYFERFLSWLLSKLFGNYNGINIYSILYNLFLYILTPLAVIFVLWKLYGADKRFFLYGGSKKNFLNFEAAAENIHEINFDKLIQEAIGKKQYRLAVRLSYLLLLKELSSKDLISWSPEKTNYDYLSEIKENKIKDQFAQNTLMYEYVWYGDFEINAENFSQVSGAFQVFTKQIKAQG